MTDYKVTPMNITNLRQHLASTMVKLCVSALVDHTQAQRGIGLLIKALEDMGAPITATKQLRKWLCSRATVRAWEEG